MGFPFNLFSIDWAAHKDAVGNDATIVPEWLAALADELPLAREEGFSELDYHLISESGLAPIAPHVVAPLLKLIESEGSKGRALGVMVLANLALCARTDARSGPEAVELLEQLQAERAGLQTLTTRHDASTSFGAALRALLAVIAAPPPSAQLTEQLAAVEALVLEADAKDEAPPPTAAQLDEWLLQVKAGEGYALGFAQRAFAVDPARALALLEADRAPGDTAVHRVQRRVLEALCRDALGMPPKADPGPWSRPAQALLLDAIERSCVKAPRVGQALLALITEPTHAIRRRAVAVRVQHAAKDLKGAWELADALARDWLQPAKAGAVNQSLERAEVLTLLGLFPPELAAARVAQLKAAPAPEVALPDGDVL